MRTVLKIIAGIVGGILATIVILVVWMVIAESWYTAGQNRGRIQALEAEVVELHKELSDYENRILQMESRADHMDDVTTYQHSRIDRLLTAPAEVRGWEC